MKKRIYLLMLCWLPVLGWAQEERIQELKKDLETATVDTVKCQILTELAELIQDDTWKDYNQELHAFVKEQLKNTDEDTPKYRTLQRYLAESLNNFGYANYYEGNLPTAISFFEQGKEIQEQLNHNKGLTVTLNNLGALYQAQGNFIKALDSYDKSLSIREEFGEKGEAATVLTNISTIYQLNQDFENALKYAKRALEYSEELESKPDIALNLQVIGSIYASQDSIETAESYVSRSLEIFKSLNNLQGIANCSRSLGELKEKQGELEEAKKYYETCLELNKELGDKRGRSVAIYHLSSILFEQGKFTESKRLALKSFQLANELGNPTVLKKTSQQLYKIYKRDGNYRDALSMHEMFKKMNDSLFNDETKNAANRAQAKYEFKRKEEQLEQERIQREIIFENQAKNQRNILIFTVLFLVILSIFLIVLYRRFKVSQEQQRIISEKEIETQKQKKILEEKNTEITDSIRYARRIQSAILPSDVSIQTMFPDSFVLYRPKDIVAGDFYWFDQVGDHLFFAAADCTGHGVPGAMVSVVCHNALDRSIREFKLTDSGEILDHTRDIIVKEFGKSNDEVNDGMDISLGVYNINTKMLKWSGAYNPLWLMRKGQLIEYKGDKQPIGNYFNPKPFTTQTIQLEFGDCLYAFSDGYQDQFGGPNGKKFKTKQIRETLHRIHDESMMRQQETLNNTLENWMMDIEQVDDICFIGIRI